LRVIIDPFSKAPSLSLRLRIALTRPSGALFGDCPASVRSVSGIFGKIIRAIQGVLMDNKFQIILDTLPKKPPRSRLEPYRELIDELRRRGRTYREIVRILAEKCQLQVSRSTVNDFVLVRYRAKRKSPKRRSPGSREITSLSPTVATEGARKQEDAPRNEVWQRINTLKLRPRTSPKGPDQFHYDPNEPLRLPTKTKKNGSGE